MAFDKGREFISSLIESFEKNHSDYLNESYNETQLRNDFLNPFLRALGWDIENRAQKTHYLRDVIQEYGLLDDDYQSNKRPDYTIRRNEKRKFFIEAKKPSVHIESNAAAAFQTRRYGWSAQLPISVLTNFEYLIIYNCRTKPNQSDNERHSRFRVYHYSEYLEQYDEIYEMLSCESMYSGAFDDKFITDEMHPDQEEFDEYFLEQIERWRLMIASDIHRSNTLDSHELNYVVQKLINRLLFLRICEDRDIEKYELLKNVSDYETLKRIFIESDERYNSGVFDLIEDKLVNEVAINDETLISIFNELYYPHCPYTFSVLDAHILGEIYEEFLGKYIDIKDGELQLIEKSEIRESKGVVPTPKYVVDYIIEKTLLQYETLSYDDLINKKMIDISCGSGVFLLSLFDHICEYCLNWLMNDGIENHLDKVYRESEDKYMLKLKTKTEILTNTIFGVDIDDQAVEVTRFGLLIKLIENESKETIDGYIQEIKTKALPNLYDNIKCGNSLVDDSFYSFDKSAIGSHKIINLVRPFNWDKEFKEIMSNGGFDVIVGNPPYLRVQRMEEYIPHEHSYYKSKHCPYLSKHKSVDKYYYFFERGIELLKDGGKLGFISPHKYLILDAAEKLRCLIGDNHYLKHITHFHTEQVFKKKTTTYVAITVLEKTHNEYFDVSHVSDLSRWMNNKTSTIVTYRNEDYGCKSWVFIKPELQTFFDDLSERIPIKLEDECEIFVGLQTSKDPIYIRTPIDQTKDHIIIRDINDDEWQWEKEILKPMLKDVTLRPFGPVAPNSYVIFPYHIEDGKAIIYTIEEMQNSFPGVWAYLTNHQELLESRSINPEGTPEWYRFGRSQSLTKFNTPKLICTTLSLGPNYVYDVDNNYITGGGNGPYYAIRILKGKSLSLQYIHAVISNPILEAFVKKGASHFRGDYYSHGKMYIANIPLYVPDLENPAEKELYDNIIELVNSHYITVSNYCGARTPSRKRLYKDQIIEQRKEIDRLVNTLYGFTNDDMKLAESLLM